MIRALALVVLAGAISNMGGVLIGIAAPIGFGLVGAVIALAVENRRLRRDVREYRQLLTLNAAWSDHEARRYRR